MFGIFDKTAKLEKQHAKKLEEARNAQRSGDIKTLALLTAEAEKLAAQIDETRGK